MLGRKWMSCGLPGPLLCSAEWSQEEQKALLFRQCHRLDLASLQDMSWPETIILVPESRGCDSKWQPGRQCGWEEPLCSKGNNLFLCLASWLPRKPTMNAAEWTVPCGDVYLPLITVLGEAQIHLGLLLVPTAKGCVTSPRLVEHPWEVFFSFVLLGNLVMPL